MAGANQTIRIDVITSANMRGVKKAQRELTNLGTTASVAAGKAAGGMATLGRISQAAGTALLVGVGAALAIGAKAAIDFESSFAGVRKTVEASEPEFQRLARAIRDLSLDIPIKVDDLNKIAELGGQLGIGAGGLTTFTEVIAKLGATTNLEIEEAATAIARFANVMGTSQTDFDRLGSTVVDLGNNFATTEKEILTFGTRLSGIGSTIGASEADILGLATAFTSLGEPAERGATAVQAVFLEMLGAIGQGGPNLEVFAELVGVTADEFERMFEADPVGTFIAFERGLDAITESGGDVTKVLSDLGLGARRTINLILKGAISWETLAEAVALANEAYADNVALDEEAEKRFETTASQLILLGNQFKDLSITIGQATEGPLKGIIRLFGGFFSIVRDNTWALTALGVAAGVLASAMVLGALAKMILNLFNNTRRFEGAVIRGLISMDKFGKGLMILKGFAGIAFIALGALAAGMANARAKTDEMNRAIKELAEVRFDPESSLADEIDAFVESIQEATAARPGVRFAIFGEDLEEVSDVLRRNGVTIRTWAEAALSGSAAFDKFSGSLLETLQARLTRLLPTEAEARKGILNPELDQAQRDLALIQELVAKTGQVMEGERVKVRQLQVDFDLERGFTLEDEIEALKRAGAKAETFNLEELLPEFALIDFMARRLGPEDAEKLYESIMKDVRSFGGDFADAWNGIIGDFADQLLDWDAIWGGYEEVVAPNIDAIRDSMGFWESDTEKLLNTMTEIFTDFDFEHRMFWLSLSDTQRAELAALRAKSPKEFRDIFEEMFVFGIRRSRDLLEVELLTISTFITGYMDQNWKPALAKAMADAGEGGIIKGTEQWDVFIGEVMNEMLISIKEFDPLLAGTLKELFDAGLGQVLGDEDLFGQVMDVLIADLSSAERTRQLFELGLSWRTALELGFGELSFTETVNREIEGFKRAAERGLEIESPSKLSRKWGRQLGEGFRMGLQESFAPTAGLLDSVFQRMAPSQTSSIVKTTSITINHPNHPTDDLKKDLQRASVLAGHQRLAEVGTINNT